MYLFDTHCHLQDDRIKNDIEGIMERAADAGITAMLCCGSEEKDWETVLELSRRYPCIKPALGLHPWYAASRSNNWAVRLEELLVSDSRIAVGEIGLDHALQIRNDDEQMAVFSEQLEMAKRLRRPVSIHCRKAWGSLMQLLRNNKKAQRGLVIHSYGGPVELIKELESYGVSLSFSGSVTHQDNRRGRAAAMAVRIDRLLIETDCPDIPPAGCTGNNEPSQLVTVAETIAKLRGMSFEEVAAETTVNAEAIFRG